MAPRRPVSGSLVMLGGDQECSGSSDSVKPVAPPKRGPVRVPVILLRCVWQAQHSATDSTKYRPFSTVAPRGALTGGGVAGPTEFASSVAFTTLPSSEK